MEIFAILNAHLNLVKSVIGRDPTLEPAGDRILLCVQYGVITPSQLEVIRKDEVPDVWGYRHKDAPRRIYTVENIHLFDVGKPILRGKELIGYEYEVYLFQ